MVWYDHWTTRKRSIKISRKLTYWRVIASNVLAKWIKLTLVCKKVCNIVEDFAQVTTQYSEQHIEFRESTVKTDFKGSSTTLTWFEQHSLFDNVPH